MKYGLGHYVGGFDGSVHKAANEAGSTWGYDSDLNVFIPNFFSSITNQDQCCCPGNSDDQCESPFMSRYKFGKDSMAGGSAGHWGSNRFTLCKKYADSVFFKNFNIKGPSHRILTYHQFSLPLLLTHHYYLNTFSTPTS